MKRHVLPYEEKSYFQGGYTVNWLWIECNVIERGKLISHSKTSQKMYFIWKSKSKNQKL